MSFALSNRWLVEAGAAPWARHDYAGLAKKHGYRFVQAEVRGIDLARRTATAADAVLRAFEKARLYEQIQDARAGAAWHRAGSWAAPETIAGMLVVALSDQNR